MPVHVPVPMQLTVLVPTIEPQEPTALAWSKKSSKQHPVDAQGHEQKDTPHQVEHSRIANLLDAVAENTKTSLQRKSGALEK